MIASKSVLLSGPDTNHTLREFRGAVPRDKAAALAFLKTALKRHRRVEKIITMVCYPIGIKAGIRPYSAETAVVFSIPHVIKKHHVVEPGNFREGHTIKIGSMKDCSLINNKAIETHFG